MGADQGKVVEAVAAYRKGIYPSRGWFSGRAHNPDILMKYALLLCTTGQNEEAIQIYQQALSYLRKPYAPLLDLRFYPGAFNKRQFEAVAHIIMGIRSIDPHHEDTYIQECQKAVALQPDFAPAYYFLGYALRSKRGHKEEARAMFEKAAKLGQGEMAKQAQEAMTQLR